MLLDTHVWIWAADGGQRLGAKTRRRLRRIAPVADDSTAACLSVASIFETVALHTADRLQFTLPVERGFASRSTAVAFESWMSNARWRSMPV